MLKRWLRVMRIMLLSVLLLSCATSLPVEDKKVGAIRYWKEDSKILAHKAMTVSDEQLVDKDVPKRADPKIVILMYHNLVYGRTGSEYNRDIYNFEHDLAFIRSRFKIIDFHDLLTIMEGKVTLESDAALLTFDDGDLSMYAIAYPLLKEYGIKATFFLITDFVGDIGYMNWSQIREISEYRDKAGSPLFSIGSHSASHRNLGDLEQAAVMQELANSKFAIEEKIGEPVEFLSLPFGSGAGKKEIIDLATSLGYKAIRISDNRFVSARAIDLYRLPGIYIDNSSTDKAMQKIWSMVGR